MENKKQEFQINTKVKSEMKLKYKSQIDCYKFLKLVKFYQKQQKQNRKHEILVAINDCIKFTLKTQDKHHYNSFLLDFKPR